MITKHSFKHYIKVVYIDRETNKIVKELVYNPETSINYIKNHIEKDNNVVVNIVCVSEFIIEEMGKD